VSYEAAKTVRAITALEAWVQWLEAIAEAPVVVALAAHRRLRSAARGADAAGRRRQRHPVQRNAGRRGRSYSPRPATLGLGGIVSKRVGSFYKSGLSRNWLKTKNPNFVRT
jgi:hypothetical protein